MFVFEQMHPMRVHKWTSVEQITMQERGTRHPKIHPNVLLTCHSSVEIYQEPFIWVEI
jgi:hypothetical protein